MCHGGSYYKKTAAKYKYKELTAVYYGNKIIHLAAL